jgi:phosphoribosylformylglycinamidine cyclo-ligase
MFAEIQRLGDVSDEEMARVFNLGVGMIVAVPPEDLFEALDLLRLAGHQGASQVGEIVAGTGQVRLVADVP